MQNSKSGARINNRKNCLSLGYQIPDQSFLFISTGQPVATIDLIISLS